MSRAFLALLLLVPGLALAQEPAAELTPFGAYAFGGTFNVEESDASYKLDDSPAWGLILNFRHRSNTQWEVFYAQQNTEAEFSEASGADPRIDVDIRVLQLGGIYQFDGDKVRPYLSATLGGTHIETDSVGKKSDTFFSGSIGVGFKVLPTSRLGLRFEARAIGTLVSNSTDLLCETGPDANVCAIRVDGTLLSQIQTFAGITFRF